MSPSSNATASHSTAAPRKVCWGVLSTAKIGLEKVIPAMQQSAWCDMHAIASRSLPRAQAAACALGMAQAYGSYFNRSSQNIRNRPETGGGALYDIGCYAIVAGRFLFGCKPLRVISLMDADPDFKTDRTFSGLLDFGGGRRLDFTVSTQLAPYQRVNAIGTQRRLELMIPFNAPLGGATDWLLDEGKLHGNLQAQVETVPPCNMYTLQGDAFSRAVRGEIALPYGMDDALCNMRIIDALFASCASGAWEPVG